MSTLEVIVESYTSGDISWKDLVRQLAEFNYVEVEIHEQEAEPEPDFVPVVGVDAPQEAAEGPLVGVGGPEPVVAQAEFPEAPEPGVVVDPVEGSFDELRKLVNDGVVDIDTYEVVCQARQIIADGGTLAFRDDPDLTEDAEILTEDSEEDNSGMTGPVQRDEQA